MTPIIWIYGLSLLLLWTQLPTSLATNLATFAASKEWPDGQLAAFADMDADRRTDIFLANGSWLDVVLMEKRIGEGSNRLNLLKMDDVIRGVVPSDFNGDSRVDLLVLTSRLDEPTGPYSAYLAYGKEDRQSVGNRTLLGIFTSHPLILDWNADMIADIYAEILLGGAKLRIVFIGGQTITNVTLSYNGLSWFPNGYSAFVDVDNDDDPDIVVMVGSKNFQFILNDGHGNFNHGHPLQLNLSDEVRSVGQPAFADFNLDNKLEMLLPVCLDEKCDYGDFYMCNTLTLQCTRVVLNWKFDQSQWSPLPQTAVTSNLTAPMVAGCSVADINLDGLPDCALVLRRGPGSDSSQVALLQNMGSFNFSLGVPTWSSGNAPVGVSQAAFFDLDEDGILDLLVSSAKSKNTQFFRQYTNGDSYFLKVMVLNGRCAGFDCPNSRLPFGLPLPGVTVGYDTEAVSGVRQSSKAPILSQTGYTALQLPFSVFGLGQFANYIEKLEVTLPSKNVDRRRAFTFFVPKSQIVVIPNPLDNPESWKTKLFLEPLYNMKVIYVAAALLGTCLVVIIIISVLQWMEIREDKLEKMQEAQRFHFDAM